MQQRPGLRDVVLRAAYVKAESADDDPLVEVDESIADWRAKLPGLVVSSISTRNGRWHLPWTYRPQETLTAVDAA